MLELADTMELDLKRRIDDLSFGNKESCNRAGAAAPAKIDYFG